MPLPLLSFEQLTQQQQSAILSLSSPLTDFTPGSILLSIIESNSANSIWIQSLASSLLAISRLQTSFGNDVDTFISQFGYSRAQASPATGVVSFTRSVTTSASYIPAATTVVTTTSIPAIQFTTVRSVTNPHYDSATDSYVIPISTSTITGIPVSCNQPGTVGNVTSGQINTIVSSLINVNSVTNPSPFTNGSNIATDDQVKIDFVLYLQGLSKATYLAIAYGVISTPLYGTQISRYQIVENKDENGATLYGFFFVVVDDGSGSPSSDLINAVKANLELYRGLSIMYDVIAPVVVNIAITVTITLDSNTMASQQSVGTLVKNALTNYVDKLPIGGVKVLSFPPNTSGNLYYSSLYEIIYNASSEIINVTSLLMDFGSGFGTADCPLNFKKVALLSASNITITWA